MKRPDFSSLIVFENENYLGINKPSGLSVLDDRSEPNGKSLLELAREVFPESQVCHRIDKETTGILIFSKKNEAYRHLAVQFEKREVAKIYHALGQGRHNLSEELIEKSITFNAGIAKIDRAGKFSATIVETISILKDFTLFECMPITGRTHQIRIHLASIGAPLVGDEKYGGSPFYLSHYKRKFSIGKEKEERPIINRAALHAYKIKFKDINGDDIVAEAAYPKDLQATITQLQRLK